MREPLATTRARLILDPPAAGSWNMAVDEALLHSAAQHGVVTLRIYSWRVPTISLGYFQPFAERRGHPASLPCPAVRRATGGGAIVHDRELTYSLTAPDPHPHTRRRDDWYDVLHTSWLATLTDWGVAATLCEQTDPTRERAFLCFLRRTKGDLLLYETKIGGSAQKRSRHAFLQHGSLLLDQSPAAPELPGISQLTSRSLDAEELTRSWTGRLAVRLGISWSAEALTDDERNRASAFDRDRYANSSWTLRR